eukprot:GHVN01056822.1.p1 GENE.GHVN01056822.1~~GHVN01056822.1.p1  ORF type:complete len:161 (-),score=18.74 GHVN01056822.1:1468-1950(-)
MFHRSSHQLAGSFVGLSDRESDDFLLTDSLDGLRFNGAILSLSHSLRDARLLVSPSISEEHSNPPQPCHTTHSSTNKEQWLYLTKEKHQPDLTLFVYQLAPIFTSLVSQCDDKAPSSKPGNLSRASATSLGDAFGVCGAGLTPVIHPSCFTCVGFPNSNK